jgi:hypothetical protein
MKNIVCAVLLAVLLPFVAAYPSARDSRGGRDANLPTTKIVVPALASYDRIVPKLLAKWEIPVAAVAVVDRFAGCPGG